MFYSKGTGVSSTHSKKMLKGKLNVKALFVH